MAKFYAKRGNTTAEEKKYIKALEKFYNDNPSEEVKQAKNIGQLKKLYEKNCIQTVDFEEVVDADDEALDKILSEQGLQSDSSSTGTGAESTDKDADAEPDDDTPSGVDKSDYIDPFSKSNPSIKNYIHDDKFSQNGPSISEGQQARTTFNEPANFKDSFDIPSADGSDNVSGAGSVDSKKDKSGPKKTEPLNPEFDSINKSYRNRKTKRMAKSFVNIFCYLLENGVPKWATRDITPEALLEQVKNKKLNLDIIISFDGETQIQITEYFKKMCDSAKDLGKIPEEIKQDLIDDLYDVLVEKGITPSPMQSLLLTLGEVVALIGIKTYAFRLQVISVKKIAAVEETEDQVHEEVKEAVQKPVQEEPTAPQQKHFDQEPESKPAAQPVAAKKRIRPPRKKKEREGNYETIKQIGDETKE